MISDHTMPGSIVVVDVETTALAAGAGAIIEIGAVGLASGEEFFASCRAPSDALIEPKALEVNGATRERVFDLSLPLAHEEVFRFSAWCRWRWLGLLAGMNPRFDLDHLRAVHTPPHKLLSHRTLDMHSLAIAWAQLRNYPLPASGLKTDEIYEMLGMPMEPKPHSAIVGARMETIALRTMLRDLRGGK